jgi:hypothetical protein
MSVLRRLGVSLRRTRAVAPFRDPRRRVLVECSGSTTGFDGDGAKNANRPILQHVIA